MLHYLVLTQYLSCDKTRPKLISNPTKFISLSSIAAQNIYVYRSAQLINLNPILLIPNPTMYKRGATLLSHNSYHNFVSFCSNQHPFWFLSLMKTKIFTHHKSHYGFIMVLFVFIRTLLILTRNYCTPSWYLVDKWSTKSLRFRFGFDMSHEPVCMGLLDAQ